MILSIDVLLLFLLWLDCEFEFMKDWLYLEAFIDFSKIISDLRLGGGVFDALFFASSLKFLVLVCMSSVTKDSLWICVLVGSKSLDSVPLRKPLAYQFCDIFGWKSFVSVSFLFFCSFKNSAFFSSASWVLEITSPSTSF